LFQLQGIKKIKKVFEEQLTSSERVANNYNPLAKNFYTLYFAKYAS
jgi:hypothetical protein